MLALFAQNANRPGPPPGAPEAALGIILGMYCLIFVFGIATFAELIWLYVRMSAVLQACRKRNRKMEPGLVWLNLVPGLMLVWKIMSILWVAESLQNEYEDRGLRGDGDFGKMMGICTYVSGLCGCLPLTMIFIILYGKKLGTYLERLNRDDRSPEDDR
jgi:hypothetical protein